MYMNVIDLIVIKSLKVKKKKKKKLFYLPLIIPVNPGQMAFLIPELFNTG